MSLIYNYTINAGGDFAINQNEGVLVTSDTTILDSDFSFATYLDEKEFLFTDGITYHDTTFTSVNDFSVDIIFTSFRDETIIPFLEYSGVTGTTNHITEVISFSPTYRENIYIDEIYSENCNFGGGKYFTYSFRDAPSEGIIGFYDAHDPVQNNFTLHGIQGSGDVGKNNIYYEYAGVDDRIDWTKKIVIFNDPEIYLSGFTGAGYLNVFKSPILEKDSLKYENLFANYIISVDSAKALSPSAKFERSGGISGKTEVICYYDSGSGSPRYYKMPINIIEVNTINSNDKISFKNELVFSTTNFTSRIDFIEDYNYLSEFANILKDPVFSSNRINMTTFYGHDYFFPNEDHLTVYMSSGYIGYYNSSGTSNKSFAGGDFSFLIGSDGVDFCFSKGCSILADTGTYSVPTVDTDLPFSYITEGYRVLDCYVQSVFPIHNFFNNEQTFLQWIGKGVHTIYPSLGFNDLNMFDTNYVNYYNTTYWNKNAN